VRLEYDQGTGRNDRYGRTLAYVYLANGTLLNLEIIERGYGHAYTRFPPSKSGQARVSGKPGAVQMGVRRLHRSRSSGLTRLH